VASRACDTRGKNVCNLAAIPQWLFFWNSTKLHNQLYFITGWSRWNVQWSNRKDLSSAPPGPTLTFVAKNGSCVTWHQEKTDLCTALWTDKSGFPHQEAIHESRSCLDSLNFYKNWFLKKLDENIWRLISKNLQSIFKNSNDMSTLIYFAHKERKMWWHRL
jgi:hypothetical protein